MKIGFILDDTLDKPDGIQQYILTLGEWLMAQGHDVHYLVGQTIRNDVIVHSLSKNIKVRFNHNRMSIPLPASRVRIKALLEEHYDVLHVQVPYSPYMAGRVIKLIPETTALIGTFHILPYGKIEKIATKALGLYLKRNDRRFDAMISVSPAAQTFAKKWYGVKSKVLPNVVDMRRYQLVAPAKKHQNIRIVFLGRLVARKGCAQLLEAISLLPEQSRENLDVIIGGKGPLQAKLIRQAEKLHLQSQVHFKGFISENDKAAFLSQADIAIFPSLGGESFGIVLIEAMAAGAGVVMGGNNPGYSSVLGAVPESLFDPRLPRAMAEQLERIIRDTDLRHRLHVEQQALVRQYDVAVVGKQLVQLYKQVIAKRSIKRHNG